jgi:hypothetical protein
MRGRLLLVAALLLSVLGVAGWLAYQDTLVPVGLGSDASLYVPARPEFGEDEAVIEALMPAGTGLDALLTAQCDLPLIEKGPAGAWISSLLVRLEGTRHGRRWRLAVRPGWRLQDGHMLDAARLEAVLGSEVSILGGEIRRIDAATVDLRFKAAQGDLPDRLSRWRVPGSGPFRRQGSSLERFAGFTHGPSGFAGLRILSDPALMQSRPWAEGLARGRWAWTVFPGNIAPEDMAKVRLAPYDELRMKDGSVWFLSRRLRRLRPNAEDWTRSRIFGAWKGSMDLPYDPLGM